MTKLVLTPGLEWILGRPNFWCANLAQMLRNEGREIPLKAEAEQAAVIHWMLEFYLADSLNWRQNMDRAIKNHLILHGMIPEDGK
jgi:hypothetical protein